MNAGRTWEHPEMTVRMGYPESKALPTAINRMMTILAGFALTDI
jgi:hypothetical protein